MLPSGSAAAPPDPTTTSNPMALPPAPPMVLNAFFTTVEALLGPESYHDVLVVPHEAVEQMEKYGSKLVGFYLHTMVSAFPPFQGQSANCREERSRSPAPLGTSR